MKKSLVLSVLSAALCTAVFIIPIVSHGATYPTNPIMGISTSTASTAWKNNPRGYAEYTIPYNTPVTVNWTGAASNGTSCAIDGFEINGSTPVVRDSTSTIWPAGLKISANGSRNVGNLTGNSYFIVRCGLQNTFTYAGVQVNVLPASAGGSAQTPSITVTSPNGGESLNGNSNYNITWNSLGIINYLYIVLDAYDQNGNKIGESPTITNINNITDNTGSYSWVKPADTVNSFFSTYQVMPAKFKIRIFSSGTIQDMSDNYFTISSAAQTQLACTALTKNLISGSVNSQVLQLENFLSAQGYFTGTPNNTLGDSTVSAIKKFQKDNGISQTGTIGPITRAKIQEISCPTITLLSPNSGEKYTPTSVVQINYKSTNITGKTISAHLYSPIADSGYSITSTATENGSIALDLSQVPALTAGQYKITLCADSVDSPTAPGKTLCDTSDKYFTVTTPQINTIKVTSPTLNNSYTVGDTISVRWTPTNAGVSKIELVSFSGSHSFAIVSSGSALAIPSVSGKYSYIITDDVLPDTYYIKLTPADRSLPVISQTFSIKAVQSSIVTPTVLPTATVGVLYGADASVGPVSGSFTDSLFSGTLPPGLSAGGGGTCAQSSCPQEMVSIYGTPNTAGDYIFTLQSKNTHNDIAKGVFSIHVVSTNSSTTQPSITINSVAGPTSLNSKQTGTWYINDVTAFPAGSQLTYSVIWADGTPVSVASGSGIPIDSAFVANSTFTHSFAVAGTYYVQFFAKNAAGAVNGKGININVADGTVPAPNHPVISLTATSTSVAYGGATQVSWSVSNAANCAKSGGWSQQNIAMSGSQQIGGLTQTTTYTISCTNSMGVSASQNLTVTVGSASATQPSVTVSTSKASYTSGEKVSISYDVANAPSGAAIEMDIKASRMSGGLYPLVSPYSLDGTTRTFDLSVAQTTFPSHGVITWTPGIYEGYLPIEGPLEIRIKSSGGILLAQTQVPITIVSTSVRPSITVTSPNTGESWTQGTTHNFTWTSNGISNVDLSLLQNSTSALVIATNIPNTGSYSWRVPTNLSGSGFQLYVAAAGIVPVRGNAFSITAPVVNQAPIGFIDSVTANFASGWTIDPDAPTVSNQVDIYIDGATASSGGTFLSRITPTTSRPDLLSMSATYTGNHGWGYTIPAQYADGKQHTLYAYGIDTVSTGQPKLLNGSPKAFTIAPVANTPPIGFIDGIYNGNVASGWTIDPDAPTVSNGVDLYINGTSVNGTLLAHITPSASRPDLLSMSSTYTGNHGWSYTIPAIYADGHNHTIYAYGIDTTDSSKKSLLLGSPKTYNSSTASVSVANTAQMANVIASLRTYIDALRGLVK